MEPGDSAERKVEGRHKADKNRPNGLGLLRKGHIMSCTTEQWMELHKYCLDTVRVILEGLADDQLVANVPTVEQSIGGLVCHIIDAEFYWLREVGIEPQFSSLPEKDRSVPRLLGILNKIEEQYQDILSRRPNDQDVLFGLGRVCQHALYHRGRIVLLRRMQDPEWRPPGPDERGALATPVTWITNLLIGRELQQLEGGNRE